MKRFGRVQKSTKQVEWKEAIDIRVRTKKLVSLLDLSWIDVEKLHFYRSQNSKARAYARTWGLPKLWQRSLNVDPAYIIEVIAERFDKLSLPDQDKVILHELTHIPRNFSGALLPHTRRTKGGVS